MKISTLLLMCTAIPLTLLGELLIVDDIYASKPIIDNLHCEKPSWTTRMVDSKFIYVRDGVSNIYAIELMNPEHKVRLWHITCPAVDSVNVRWDAPTKRVDKKPLSKADIGGYRLLFAHENMKDSKTVKLRPEVTTTTVNGLAPGRWFVTIVTTDKHGTDSAFSEVTEFNL